MNNDLMFSSATDLWATPQDFYDKLNRVFDFTLDPCATHENAKCPVYFTEADDGLSQSWLHHVVFCNPPYGRGIGAWVKKAYETGKAGGMVVMLLPARTDTQWWHDYCAKGEVTLLKGRLKFGDAKNSAPFPSAVVVFRPTVADAIGVAA